MLSRNELLKSAITKTNCFNCFNGFICFLSQIDDADSQNPSPPSESNQNKGKNGVTPQPFCIIRAMPKILERDGYRFFFYSNEHRPIHVHVRYGSGEAVFELENQVELRESFGLKVRE